MAKKEGRERCNQRVDELLDHRAPPVHDLDGEERAGQRGAEQRRHGCGHAAQLCGLEFIRIERAPPAPEAQGPEIVRNHARARLEETDGQALANEGDAGLQPAGTAAAQRHQRRQELAERQAEGRHLPAGSHALRAQQRAIQRRLGCVVEPDGSFQPVALDVVERVQVVVFIPIVDEARAPCRQRRDDQASGHERHEDEQVKRSLFDDLQDVFRQPVDGELEQIDGAPHDRAHNDGHDHEMLFAPIKL